MAELVVAFQGEPGAYSEQACRQYFGPAVRTLPCHSFQALFEAVHQQRASHIMLPVENSLAGTVSGAFDLLIDYDLRVQGEEIVRVEHCLLAPAGVALGDIRRVLSHPQALAQCAKTLARLGIEPISFYDTAGAARHLARQPEAATGALASQLAAETYGLHILSRDMQDWANNFTRFFVLGREDGPRRDPSKTSIIFTTRHDNRPGALYRVLGELAQRDINMTKIESRPRPNVPWHYRFHIDFEGHEDEPRIQEALAGILRHTSFLKVLGSYAARTFGEAADNGG